MRFVSVRPRIDALLPLVERPGRYIGLERNVVRKDLAGASVTLALAFPDTYEIGMSHTGLKILYEIVNRRPDFACERVYAPWTDLEANMLELAGLPVWQRDRRETDPIVLGGGPCTANPEPLADFFDAFLVGDAEEALPRFLDVLRDARAAGLARSDVLALLAALEGVYVPSFYDVLCDERGRITSITRNNGRAPERARRTWV